MITYHFISTLLNAYFDSNISLAKDAAIDIVKCALLDKVMQGSPCPKVCPVTNENWCYL